MHPRSQSQQPLTPHYRRLEIPAAALLLFAAGYPSQFVHHRLVPPPATTLEETGMDPQDYRPAATMVSQGVVGIDQSTDEAVHAATQTLLHHTYAGPPGRPPRGQAVVAGSYLRCHLSNPQARPQMRVQRNDRRGGCRGT
jgi:hypothetical protein